MVANITKTNNTKPSKCPVAIKKSPKGEGDVDTLSNSLEILQTQTKVALVAFEKTNSSNFNSVKTQSLKCAIDHQKASSKTQTLTGSNKNDSSTPSIQRYFRTKLLPLTKCSKNALSQKTMMGKVIVFSHADVNTVIRDAEKFSSKSNHTSVPHGLDGEVHQLAREAIAGAFTDEKMIPLFPKYRQIASDLVEEMLNKNNGMVDGQEFAFLYSARIQLALLNWDQNLDTTCIAWTKENIRAQSENDRPASKRNALAWNELVYSQLNNRRSRIAMGLHKDLPTDTTDDLLNAKAQGKSMTDEQIASLIRNLNMGLVSSLACNIGNSVPYLATNPDLQNQVRNNLCLLPDALDEMTRLIITGSLVMCKRTTTCPVEIGNPSIPAGEQVTVNWISANRDPTVFDEPKKFKFGRDHANKNMMYGAGPHEWMGIQLARIQLQIAFEELLKKTTNIGLNYNGLCQKLTYPANGFENLPIRIECDSHERKEQQSQQMIRNLLEQQLAPIQFQQQQLHLQIQQFKEDQLEEHLEIEKTFQTYSNMNFVFIGSVIGIMTSLLFQGLRR
eukprot:Awhi_evm1s13347